jgi:hypothetical protein
MAGIVGGSQNEVNKKIRMFARMSEIKFRQSKNCLTGPNFAQSADVKTGEQPYLKTRVRKKKKACVLLLSGSENFV